MERDVYKASGDLYVFNCPKPVKVAICAAMTAMLLLQCASVGLIYSIYKCQYAAANAIETKE